MRELDEDRLRINRLVSTQVYHEMKFICDQAEFDAYHDIETLGHYVMEKLKVPNSCRAHYWTAYKDHVSKTINILQCTNTNAIKKVWKGETVSEMGFIMTKHCTICKKPHITDYWHSPMLKKH
jgi:hypothetical protein